MNLDLSVNKLTAEISGLFQFIDQKVFTSSQFEMFKK